MKKILMIVVAMVMAIGAFPTVAMAQANNEVTVLINGVPLESDVPAQLVNGSTMVPMRAIFETLNPECQVEWNGQQQTIQAVWSQPFVDESSGRLLHRRCIMYMIIGQNIIVLNDERIEIPQAPIIIGGRTMVPLRVVAEAFGADVQWNGATRTVTITTAQVQIPNTTTTTGFTLTNGQLDRTPENLALMEKELLRLINEYRVEQGVHALQWDDRIADAARLHAYDLVHGDHSQKEVNTSHMGSDGSMHGDRIRRQPGFGSGGGAECVGTGSWSLNINGVQGYTTAQFVFDMWKNSIGHNQGMLMTIESAIGIPGFSDYNHATHEFLYGGVGMVFTESGSVRTVFKNAWIGS